MTEEPRAPIIPGPPGDTQTVVLILARYYPGPITNPEHKDYVDEYVRLNTSG
jgi:hypothetical protein